MKILGIDYGKKYIGFAISDETEIVAATMPYMKAKKKKEALDGTLAIIKNMQPGAIVLGKPSKGEMVSEVETFAQSLHEATGLDIIFWNEDYSSKKAEVGKSIKFKKGKSHSEAARIILQEYLDSEYHQEKSNQSN